MGGRGVPVLYTFVVGLSSVQAEIKGELSCGPVLYCRRPGPGL